MLIKRLAILALAAFFAACSGKGDDAKKGENPMTAKNAESENSGETVRLVADGATFPQPLYQRWFAEYNNLHPSVEVSYQGIGSGGGVRDFIGHRVDFAASDAAMTDEEMSKVNSGVFLLPMTAGGIVITYNLPGVQHLKLSRDAYVGIFMGTITKWNDPNITKDNPGVDLPDKPITVCVRSDGSGTTYVFTGHLSAVSSAWKSGPGQGKSINWPCKNNIGGKGNPGVTQNVKRTEGAIGYVEYAYATQLKLPMATLQNKAGDFVDPTPENCRATLAAVKLPENMRAYVTDPGGARSYPIVTYTWILAYKRMTNPTKKKAFQKLIHWCLTEGQKISPELGYISLPKSVVDRVSNAVDKITG